ncbi:MAG TPA: GNAT family N-acetyltransferase [Spirochaetota bacterium]|nr:GNAT family N-acetyltransferase [Spirochaetota bacterium]
MKLSEKGIIIRKAVESDLRQIYLSVKEMPLFINAGFTAEKLAELFMSENSIILTAARKKKILGFIAGNKDEKKSFIQYLFVNEKFRGSGIGSALIEKYLIRGKKSGAEDFFIALPENNMESLNFCIKKGFSREENRVILRKKEN